MWWFFWSIEERFKDVNARLDRLEARVDTLEQHVRELALCMKAMTQKLQ